MRKGVKEITSMSKKLPAGCKMRIYFNYLSRKAFFVRGNPEGYNVGDLFCGEVEGHTTMDEVEKMIEKAIKAKFGK